MRAADADFAITYVDAAHELAHIALTQRGILIAQPGAGDFSEARDVALRGQVARHLPVLFQRRDHAQRFIPLAFDLRQRTAENIAQSWRNIWADGSSNSASLHGRML